MYSFPATYRTAVATATGTRQSVYGSCDDCSLSQSVIGTHAIQQRIKPAPTNTQMRDCLNSLHHVAHDGARSSIRVLSNARWAAG